MRKIKKLDLTGQKYGSLTVLEEDKDKSTPDTVRWKCRCDCGKLITVSGRNLRSGNTKSCGCYQRNKVSQMFKKYNTYDLSGEYGIGYDCKGNTFTFDLDDYALIKDYCWVVHKEYRKKSNDELVGVGYYVTGKDKNNKTIRLHRLIKNVLDDPTILVDHIDHNGCNNRKSNLRICNMHENARNVKPRKNTSSQYKGVCYEKATGKWVATIHKDKITYKLGRFLNEEEAAIAYNNAAKELFGEYAYLNEIHYNNEIKEITN